MNEIIKYWLINLYESEIEEVEGTISNNKLCIYGAKNADEERMFIQNEMDMREYIDVLKELKKNIDKL